MQIDIIHNTINMELTPFVNTLKNTKLLTRALLCCPLIAAMLFSCNEPNGFPDERSAQQDSSLNIIDDSLYALSPHVRALIENGIKRFPDSMSYYEYTIRRGVIYGLYLKSDSCLTNAHEVLAFAFRQKEKTSRLQELIGRSYANIGCFYFTIKMNPDSALHYYLLAYDYFSKSDNKTNLCDISANIADTYAQKNDMTQCASWYRRGLFLVDSMQLPKSNNISIYLGLAQTYTYIRDYQTAQYYYSQTEKQLGNLRPNMRIFFLNNYGNFFYFKQDYPNALRQFRRLEQMLTDLKMANSLDMKVCRLNMADVFVNLDMTDSAEAHLQGLDEYFNKQHLEAAKYYVNTIRIALAVKEGHYTEAKRLINAEDVQGMEISDMQDIRNRYLRQYYLKTGDYKHAYENILYSTHRNDSIEKSKSHVRSAEIMMRFSQDTLALHKQILIDKQEKHARNMYLWLIVAAALVVILTLMIIAGIFYMRKRRLQGDFNMLQMRLENIRSRISPHFIFNVLNHEMNKVDEHTANSLMTTVQLIRDGLNISHHTYISLREELDFVRKYIQIVSSIIGEDFEYSIECPEGNTLEQEMIPSMFVQILVENAIKHGLKMKEGEKRLSIRVEMDIEGTLITVIDNGVGFSISHNEGTGTHTGLNVIRQTIMVINSRSKQKMRFNITNTTDNHGGVSGCCATLKIPHGIESH